ncbi:hypothetical protein GF337_09395 [candidate division KSB1 bacterium]|nr:hypothetical protein [candidate division KSB1 bacterium]
MSQKFQKLFLILFIFGGLLYGTNFLMAQESGYLWIKTFKPGSADLRDASIERTTLARLDSLTKRDDLEFYFLGATDNLKWKQSGKVEEISKAWDEAKKLERASSLRERYGIGEIGTTDDLVRGVKVVWGPKKPNIFSMKKKLSELEQMADSLRSALHAARSEQTKQIQEIKALEDSIGNKEPEMSMTSIAEIQTSNFDWEFKSGFFFWSGGNPYDLAAPYVGLVLKRRFWSVEFQGGFSPWTQQSQAGKLSDAFLMGTFNLNSEYWYDLKFGLFSGWEFLTNSDNWTMKTLGLTAGPNIHWRFLNTYIGYNLGKVSTLYEQEKWVHGIIMTINFKVKIN